MFETMACWKAAPRTGEAVAGGTRAIVVVVAVVAEDDMEVVLRPPALALLPSLPPPGDGALVEGWDTGGDHLSGCLLRLRGSGSDSCRTRSWSARALAAAIVCLHLLEVASAEARKASESVMVARRASADAVAGAGFPRLKDERCLLSPDADRERDAWRGGASGDEDEDAEKGEVGRDRAMVARVSDAVLLTAWVALCAAGSGSRLSAAPLEAPPSPPPAKRGTTRAGSHGEDAVAFEAPPSTGDGSILFALSGPLERLGLAAPDTAVVMPGRWWAITDPKRDPVEGAMAAVLLAAVLLARPEERGLVADEAVDETAEAMEEAVLALLPRVPGSGIALLRR